MERVMSRYSDWGMRGWPMLGSVPFMGSGVFYHISNGSLPNTLLML